MSVIRNLILILVCITLLPLAMAEETKTAAEPSNTESVAQPMGQPAPPVGKLIIEVTNIKKQKGDLLCRIYNSKETFPSKKVDKMFRLITTPVNGETATITVDQLPLGEYGIVIHHDRNSDGKMNKTWYRAPKEPVGCSRGAKGNFGPPKWNDAVIELNQHELTISINMN